jgi:hypothetical protein
VDSSSQATWFGFGVQVQRTLALGVEKRHDCVALFGPLQAKCCPAKPATRVV